MKKISFFSVAQLYAHLHTHGAYSVRHLRSMCMSVHSISVGWEQNQSVILLNECKPLLWENIKIKRFTKILNLKQIMSKFEIFYSAPQSTRWVFKIFISLFSASTTFVFAQKKQFLLNLLFNLIYWYVCLFTAMRMCALQHKLKSKHIYTYACQLQCWNLKCFAAFIYILIFISIEINYYLQFISKTRFSENLFI